MLSLPFLLTVISLMSGTTSVAASGAGYDDPRLQGGSMLTSWPNTTGNGEPLNAILSGNSDPAVLVDSLWKGGLQNYMLSGHMAPEFLGLHKGARQLANLGDGQGTKEEMRVLRYDYGDPILGTGEETLVGGNHLRLWHQATSGAYFLAVSAEKDLSQKHDIIPNGYNIGRDQFVSDLVGQKIDTNTVKAGDTFEGDSSFKTWTYHTKVEYVAGLLDATSEGINHAETVGNGEPAIDGLVAVLTVTIKKKGIFSFLDKAKATAPETSA